MLNSTMVEELFESKVSFGLIGRINNCSPSLEDLGIVDRFVIKGSKNSNSLGMSALSHEPSRRFR
jgi:hypothetical protein